MVILSSPSPKINHFPPSFNTCFLHLSIHCPIAIMGPKASASQRKLRRENSVCKLTKTHSLQQSHSYHPLFSLFS